MSDPATLPEGWTEGEVQTDGIRLHYTRTGGDGPPLVVAHGVFDDGPCRTPLLREFADEYDVVAFDARGHGRSDAPETGYGFDDRVADLVGLLDALEIEDPVLFGHSMGGDTVLATAAAHPDRPRAVVAVDPASLLEPDRDDDGADNDDGADDGDDVPTDADGPDDVNGAEADDETDEDGDDDVDEEMIEGTRQQILWWHDHSKAELLEADDELRGHVESGEDELASLLADARLRVSPNITGVFRAGWLDPAATFPDVDAPTLVLRADVDPAQRDRDRERVDLIPDSRLVHVDGAGHCVFRDQREVATREMRAFLDEV